MKTNLAAVPSPPLNRSRKASSGQETIEKWVTDEIVIALCGPLGTPLHQVARSFERLLSSRYDYKYVKIIKLSKIIREKSGLSEDEESIEKLISAGNELRDKFESNVLAAEAIKLILQARSQLNPTLTEQNCLFENQEKQDYIVSPTPVLRHCHIIDSIKNIEELRLLRSVYGDMLHVVGVYTPIELRIESLSRKVSGQDEIHALIDRDSGEEKASGQSVAATFPQADFFLRADVGTDSELEAPVQRLLDLMLGTKIVTPTKIERAMYAAYSAARNSACLSRQVGASLTSAEGDVIAIGWNDVPRPSGGLYEFDEQNPADDHRCWNKSGGICFNDQEKDILALTIADVLIKEDLLDPSQKNKAAKKIRSNQKLKGLIEFSRAVHAEMHAILNAGTQHGDRIKGGKLFVTTYPCHSCARHIIAAGIKDVYFLEPYRKSMATKLHSDAITEKEQETGKVRLLPFHGVAPSRFLKFFSAPDSGRKDSSGRMMENPPFPVTARNLEAVTTLEKIAVRGLKSLGQTAPEISP